MDYVVTGLYARRMLRSLRCDRGAAIIPLSWSRSVGSIRSGAYTPLTEEDCTRLGMQNVPTKKHPMKVIVPDACKRFCRRDEIESQVLSKAIPGKLFVKVSPQIAIAGPELLFIDAVATLPLHRALLLGMELCGTYSLRQSFPSGERPVYGIEPATTVDNISKAIKYLSGSRFRGAGRAKDVLPLLMEGSASPMESVLALMLRLPIRRGGLGLGIPQLNPVIPIDDSFRRFTSMESFRPDIYFERIPIDLEYESEEFHPDLGDLDMLDAESRAAILKKSQSDKQRMRLIQSVGIRVFQVTYEDFKTDEAFDRFIEQLLKQIEDLTGSSMNARLKKLGEKTAVQRRSILLASMLKNREA